ncbi:MAG: PAS domain S-box protein [Alphaproteobacteria bacterium]|nr:PAS domain S-box protein [Alphaproteobacteria bacterium]
MPDASEQSASRFVVGRGKLWMLFFGVLALSATVLLWVRELHQDELLAQDLFNHQSQLVAGEIGEQLSRYEVLLRAGAGFFLHNHDVKREEWRRFVEAMRLDQHFPGADGIGLVRRVRASERSAFLAAAHKENPNFRILPESDRTEYFVNFLLEPERVYNAEGLDIASRKDRKEAALKAMESGQMAITAKTTLVTPGASGSDLVMYLPLYRQGVMLESVEARRNALWGWVAGGLSVSRMMLEIQERSGPWANISIYDGREDKTEALLFNSERLQRGRGLERYRFETVQMIGGRPWLLRFSSRQQFEEQVRSGRAIIILAAGLAASIFMILAAWLFLSSRARYEAQAKRQIVDLASQFGAERALLEAAPVCVLALDSQGTITKANAGAGLMTGLAAEALVGRNFTEIFVLDKDRATFAWGLHTLKSGGGPLNLEMALEKSGERRLVSWTFSILHEAGKAADKLVAVGSDVTGYRQVEETLQAERALFVSGHVVVFRWKAETGWPVIYVSPNVSQFGCSSGALLSGDLPYINLIHPDDLGRVAAEVSRFTAQGMSVFEQKYRLVRPSDGEVRWVDDRTVVERDASGKPVSYLGYLVDVTDRERAWEASRATEARISRVLATSSEGYWELDASWRTIAVNPSLLKMLEVAEVDIMGKEPVEFVAPGWEERLRAVAQDRLKCANRSFEMGYRSAKGRVFLARVNATSLFDSQGHFLGSFGLLTDITAEKLAEEALKNEEGRLRLIVDSVPLALIISRIDEAVVVNANNAAHLLFGLDAEDMKGMLSSEFYADPNDRKHFIVQLREMGVVTDFEVRMKRKDGSVFWALLNGRLIHFENADCVLVGARDVSTRKEAEFQRAKMAEELARSNAELEQFAYVASHDLQEPLRMIASYVQLLERRYKEQLGDDAREYIAYAVDGAKRMQTLITDLLEFSRITRMGSPFSLVSLQGIVEEALGNLTLAIRETGADIRIDALPEVEGDSVQLVRLFQNLISNALKYRHPDRVPMIRISSCRLDGHWEIRVEDNGIGINEVYFERIFIIFQRLHTRIDYPGTGIGLSLCKKIVERHGGHIRVDSKEGEYSAFTFTLPAH